MLALCVNSHSAMICTEIACSDAATRSNGIPRFELEVEEEADGKTGSDERRKNKDMEESKKIESSDLDQDQVNVSTTNS